jgi:hypothetical protein
MTGPDKRDLLDHIWRIWHIVSRPDRINDERSEHDLVYFVDVQLLVESKTSVQKSRKFIHIYLHRVGRPPSRKPPGFVLIGLLSSRRLRARKDWRLSFP